MLTSRKAGEMSASSAAGAYNQRSRMMKVSFAFMFRNLLIAAARTERFGPADFLLHGHFHGVARPEGYVDVARGHAVRHPDVHLVQSGKPGGQAREQYLSRD